MVGYVVEGKAELHLEGQMILLDSESAATIKTEMVAVEVKGMKAGAKTVIINYKTNGKQNIVNFSFNPQTVWNAGKYKINVLFDGRQSASKEFEITKPESTNKCFFYFHSPSKVKALQ